MVKPHAAGLVSTTSRQPTVDACHSWVSRPSGFEYVEICGGFQRSHPRTSATYGRFVRRDAEIRFGRRDETGAVQRGMRPPRPADPRRSALMSRVRQRGTDAELVVASTLRRLGVPYRRNVVSLPGSPDLANRKRKFAAFVNGCFWHHHRACRRATVPKTNEIFWREKFSANRARDARSIRALRQGGFLVILVWECETENEDALTERLLRLLGPDSVGRGNGQVMSGGRSCGQKCGTTKTNS